MGTAGRTDVATGDTRKLLELTFADIIASGMKPLTAMPAENAVGDTILGAYGTWPLRARFLCATDLLFSNHDHSVALELE